MFDMERRTDIPSRVELERFSDEAGKLLATRVPVGRVRSATDIDAYRRLKAEHDAKLKLEARRQIALKPREVTTMKTVVRASLGNRSYTAGAELIVGELYEG